MEIFKCFFGETRLNQTIFYYLQEQDQPTYHSKLPTTMTTSMCTTWNHFRKVLLDDPDETKFKEIFTQLRIFSMESLVLSRKRILRKQN